MAVVSILYADKARARRTPIAPPAEEQSLDFHLHRAEDRPRLALHRVEDRLRPARNWCAAWAWWTRVRVGDALRQSAEQAAQHLADPASPAARVHDEMTVQRRRPRAVPPTAIGHRRSRMDRARRF